MRRDEELSPPPSAPLQHVRLVRVGRDPQLRHLDGPCSSPSASHVPLAELWLAEHHQFAVLALQGKLHTGTLYELRLTFNGLLNIDSSFHRLFRRTCEDQVERREIAVAC
ncbi:UNVERIFIED_CONTAM: hypothetical protein K2H54_041009 [Gekko kuhli]